MTSVWLTIKHYTSIGVGVKRFEVWTSSTLRQGRPLPRPERHTVQVTARPRLAVDKPYVSTKTATSTFFVSTRLSSRGVLLIALSVHDTFYSSTQTLPAACIPLDLRHASAPVILLCLEHRAQNATPRQ